MISNRKVRLMGLAGLLAFCIVVLYRSGRSSGTLGLGTFLSNTIIDSKNDDRLDAAINDEILRLGEPVVNADDKDTHAQKQIVEAIGLDKPRVGGVKGVKELNDDISKAGGSGLVKGDLDDGKDDVLHKGSYDSSDFDPAKELLAIRELLPVTIFSKTFCPYSKRAKKLLQDHYEITPQPAIVELDKHSHGAELQDYVGEISGRRTVPNLLVGTSLESRGGCDDIVKYHEEGRLAELLTSWGGKGLIVKKKEVPLNL